MSLGDGQAGAAADAVRDPALDSSSHSPDEGLIEDFAIVDKKTVEQLTEGLISHYLPDLQRSKLALKELTQNQEVLLETLQQEISKFKECSSVLDINVLVVINAAVLCMLDLTLSPAKHTRAHLEVICAEAAPQFSEAKCYHNKLVNVRKEMMLLHDKTSKLKKRALRLQQKRQKEELEREQQREKELEREKRLTAKPAKRT